MCEVYCLTRTVVVAFESMPLLTELVSGEDGFCYIHGAPNGAVPPQQLSIPPQTAKNHRLQVKCFNHSYLGIDTRSSLFPVETPVPLRDTTENENGIPPIINNLLLFSG